MHVCFVTEGCLNKEHVIFHSIFTFSFCIFTTVSVVVNSTHADWKCISRKNQSGLFIIYVINHICTIYILT